MKKMIFVLAMLLTAATAYTQTSRKPANHNTATNPKENATNHSRVSNGTKEESFAANSRRSENTSVTNTRTEQTTQQRSVNRETNTVERHRNDQNSTTPETRENNENRVYTNSNNVHNERQHRVSDNPSHRVDYESPRVYRDHHAVVHHYNNPPANREYRSIHYIYRRPVNYEVYWTPVIYRHFIEIYPMVEYWDYNPGYRIDMISAYDAMFYRGDVRTVYGEVFEVFYSWKTDEYFLYFGAYYPYQDFTVILPGYLARRYSHNPERYLENRCIAVTGLITSFNGEPEIVVKKSFQINLY
jgi:hypothetical protein